MNQHHEEPPLMFSCPTKDWNPDLICWTRKPEKAEDEADFVFLCDTPKTLLVQHVKQQRCF